MDLVQKAYDYLMAFKYNKDPYGDACSCLEDDYKLTEEQATTALDQAVEKINVHAMDLNMEVCMMEEALKELRSERGTIQSLCLKLD